MQPQSEKSKHKTKTSNPLNDIAANLGVTPKVLTELATGDDKEFRELVRGIFSILPENEVVMVASDPGINPEFLDYLCKLFDTNQKILLTILQNPSSDTQTKQFILDHLPEDIVSAIAQSSKTSPALNQMITERFKLPKISAPPQTDEFKIKMKVSRLLNDLEANLGVSIDAFLQIKARDDEQSREFVHEVYNALPEDHVLIVASDPGTTPLILNYLSRMFDTNRNVLSTILQNPTTDEPTRHLILERLPEEALVSMAGDPKVPPELLSSLGKYCTTSEDIQLVLLANPATPKETKRVIQGGADEEEIEEVTEDLLIIDDQETSMQASEAEDLQTSEAEDLQTSEEEEMEAHLLTDFFRIETEEETGTAVASDDMDAKIALCVERLYAINADTVSQYVKKAHAEILKRLKLISRANRLILTTIVKNPSLTIEDLDNIDMKTFMGLLQKSPGTLNDKTVLKLLQQAKKKKKE